MNPLYGIFKIVSNFLFHVIVYMCKMNFDVFLLFVARQIKGKSSETRKKHILLIVIVQPKYHLIFLPSFYTIIFVSISDNITTKHHKAYERYVNKRSISINRSNELVQQWMHSLCRIIFDWIVLCVCFSITLKESKQKRCRREKKRHKFWKYQILYVLLDQTKKHTFRSKNEKSNNKERNTNAKQ